MNNIHTCSYSCDRPECIKAQRDEIASAAAQEAVEWQQCQKFDGVFGNWHRITKEQYDAFSARPEHYRMVRALYAAPVTAAPGIDLTPLWRLSDAWLKALSVRGLGDEEKRLRWAMAKELRDALSLIDASPKGALNEQFVSAE